MWPGTDARSRGMSAPTSHPGRIAVHPSSVSETTVSSDRHALISLSCILRVVLWSAAASSEQSGRPATISGMGVYAAEDAAGCLDDVLDAVVEAMSRGADTSVLEFRGSRTPDLAEEMSRILDGTIAEFEEVLEGLLWTGACDGMPVPDKDWEWDPSEHSACVRRILGTDPDAVDSETLALQAWLVLACSRVAKRSVADAVADWYVRNGFVDRLLEREGLGVTPDQDQEPGFLRSLMIVAKAWRRARRR